MTDWKLVRQAVSAGDLTALGATLGPAEAAAGPWWLVQLAPDERIAVAVIDQLLSAGASVESKDSMDNRALHLAVKSVAALDRLLAAGATVDAVNERGHSPLMFAADQGPPAAVKRLLAAGAQVNHVGADGATALLFACDRGRAESVRLLLDAGARIDVVDKSRRTPLRVARSTLGRDEALLQRLGWRPRPQRPAPPRRPPVVQPTPARRHETLAGAGALPELRALADRLPADARELLEGALTSAEFEQLPLHVYEGDQSLEGTVPLEPAVHLFTASLSVAGALIVPSSYALLLIAGDLRVGHLVDQCCTVVGGSLEATGLVFGESGSDRMLVVAGDLKARVVAEDGHSIHVTGDLAAAQVMSLHNVITSRAGQVAPFTGEVDDVLDERVTNDGHVDSGELVSLLRLGVDPVLAG